MNESLQKLEQELAGFEPAKVPDTLIDGIKQRLCKPQPLSWDDRLLVAAMSIGALAACMIVALLTWDFAEQRNALPGATIAQAPPLSTPTAFGPDAQALAMAQLSAGATEMNHESQ